MAQNEQPADTEPARLTREELDDKPWTVPNNLGRKYIGYKELARYMAADDDFLALRRFDKAHCRLLLMLQAQVAEIEEELDLLNESLSQRQAKDVDNGSVRHDTPERKEVLGRLHRKIREYDELLCRYANMKARPQAPRKTVKNIKTWLQRNMSPIAPEEAKAFDAQDLMSLARSQKSAVRHLTEQYLLAPTHGLFGLLAKRQQQRPDDHVFQGTLQGSDDQLDFVTSVIIFVSATAMLIAPLWILTTVHTLQEKLAVITAFLVAFLAILTWGTISRAFEILAATAGYSAVLVVFLQIGDSK
ncbi:hypothetical protein QBC34DRAFT_427655 [Podospora aff. communis PSN243]|uniref:DUF6594 domain-containing protein n=1 Tax=Podospora aff. communis PSN243 TaxID=3040156 RepID=A0AAV9GG46_9PEZI|nr:hypothetical protein QBC34DRAFT_427655 [Podospora aff. communis PSN243]